MKKCIIVIEGGINSGYILDINVYGSYEETEDSGYWEHAWDKKEAYTKFEEWLHDPREDFEKFNGRIITELENNNESN